jgi:hypothetical protein
MGRCLAVLLSRKGCHVAACDVRLEALEETRSLCADNVKVTVHLCDVSDAAAVARLREEVEAAHGETVALLFNNAGVAGPTGSFLNMPKESWDRAFNINLHGLVTMTRTFLPTIVKQDKGYVVNTSSVNGYWAAIGPPGSKLHNPYATSKFAVRGFTESLMMDLRFTHPHVGVAVVHPGHIGTKIASNTVDDGFSTPDNMTDTEMNRIRMLGRMMGYDWSNFTKAQLIEAVGQIFENSAPVSAEKAAGIILDGVAAGSTRILVGEDARVIDWMVRLFPRGVYTSPGTYFMLLWCGIANKLGAPGGVPMGRYALPSAIAAGGALIARQLGRRSKL